MSLREHIIDETTKMFVTYGIKSIRMDDIASNLGISKRTIYEIFEDKDTLITECLTYYFGQVADCKKRCTANAGNIIEEFLMLMENGEHDMEVHYKLMMGVKKFYPKLYDKITAENSAKGHAILKNKLEQGVKEGYLLNNINYDLAVSVFSYSVFGIISRQNNILPHNVSEIDAFRYVITYFLRGIATATGIKMIDEYIGKLTMKTNPEK